MTLTQSPVENDSGTLQLPPKYALPIAIILIALPIFFLQPWVSLGIELFGLFLLYQTTVIRLAFTPTELQVYRSDTLIRQFPYQAWQAWRVFWPRLPILFYFREVNSIHFLPVLFDARTLIAQLECHCSEQHDQAQDTSSHRSPQ